LARTLQEGAVPRPSANRVLKIHYGVWNIFHVKRNFCESIV